MNGIHDMGGMHGFGRIEYEANEPVFHHAWEGRVYAMPVPVPRGFRYAIESMHPQHYLSTSYYEKWLHIKIQGLIEAGVVTQDEFDERVAYFRGHPDASPPRREDPELKKRVVVEIHAPESHRREVDRLPEFGIGDVVRARNIHPEGHTRLPRYVRGKSGEVVGYYGAQENYDNAPPGVEAPAQPLYSVRFTVQELWGDSAEPNSAVYVDMWESYLEPR